jgi:hypothetical protein
MDARVPLSQDDMNTCLWAINMVPTEYAMRVRRGYREWQVGLGAEVRTIIPYTGAAEAGGGGFRKRISKAKEQAIVLATSGARLFACTENGIYDVTVADQAPVLKVAFATQSADAGFGVYTHYVDESGDDLIFYADGENGLFRYDPAGDTWAQATGITAVATALGPFVVTDVNFVVVHKLRVWLIMKNTNKAWYLPIRSAQGEATEFFFAAKFKHGGSLIGLYNWTIDGGLGRDDHLVAVGRGGDVIPYTGEDPSDSMTWTSTGTFYIGPVPRGTRTASEYGGELFLLSSFGISTMSDLMSGGQTSDPFRNTIGHKISRLLRQDLLEYGDDHGWNIKLVADIGSIMVSTPKRSDGKYRQYVYNIATGGWGLWRDVPLRTSDPWRGALMIGTDDGRVCRMDIDSDNQLLDETPGLDISWFLLTNYSALGAPAIHKQVILMRPNFVTERKPVYEVSAHYDYRIDEPIIPTGSVPSATGDVWDTGVWDQALWSVELQTPDFKPLGGSGIGRAVAVALTGVSREATNLISIDVLWDAGGML